MADCNFLILSAAKRQSKDATTAIQRARGISTKRPSTAR
jgi:hypothetical protein